MIRGWLIVTVLAAAACECTAAAVALADTRPATQQNVTWQAPIVIRAGGAYSGNWRSDHADRPAVEIATADPVVLERCQIRGRGDLVRLSAPHGHVAIRDCIGQSDPPGVAGRSAGRFFTAEDFDSVTLEHNELIGTAGIYLLGYGGGPKPTGVTLRVVANRVRNIDGRLGDGHGGYLPFNIRRRGDHEEKGFELVQFLQLDKVRNIPRAEIAWNQVINEPGCSRVEDNINIYLSSGLPNSPLQIHDNYIQGGFTIRPEQADCREGDWECDWSYSGGGILIGDGEAASAAEAPAFVVAHHNTVVGTTNYGIAIASGHDLQINDNRVVSCGMVAGRPIAAQNVGIYIWDHAKTGPRVFFNNSGRGNVIGWKGAQGRNDSWTPDAARFDGTPPLPDPLTPATEAAELDRWNQRVSSAGIAPGLRPHAQAAVEKPD